MSDFQVLLLAVSGGPQMHPLTTTTPKALLPLANRPLLSYQLEYLELAGIQKVTLVCADEHKETFGTYMEESYRGALKWTIEHVPRDFGTAQTLYSLKHQLTSDVIVIPGDILLGGQALHRMADVHRREESLLTMLLAPRLATQKKCNLFVAMPSGSDRIVHYQPATCAVDSSGERPVITYTRPEAFTVNKQLCSLFPNMEVQSTLSDAHVYIVSILALSIFSEEKWQSFHSLQYDAVPALVRAQFRRPQPPHQVSKAEARAQLTPLLASTASYDLANSMATNSVRQLASPLQCFAVRARTGDAIVASAAASVDAAAAADVVIRVRTVDDYREATRQVCGGQTPFAPLERAVLGRGKSAAAQLKGRFWMGTLTKVDPKTAIGPDCVVGDGVTIGERCSLKKSVIGKHCQVGDFSKLQHSVIMDHVTIGVKCHLQNVVVCSNASIADGCVLKNCTIGSGYTVKENAENEIICDERVPH